MPSRTTHLSAEDSVFAQRNQTRVHGETELHRQLGWNDGGDNPTGLLSVERKEVTSRLTEYSLIAASSSPTLSQGPRSRHTQRSEWQRSTIIQAMCISREQEGR